MIRHLTILFVAIFFIFFSNTLTLAVTTPTDCSLVNENRIIPLKECEALLDLYNSTNGEGWTDNTGWNKDNNPCSWYGITCVTTPDGGFVQEISLPLNGLTGPLPDSIGAPGSFSRLTVLYLSRNALTGQIPSNLGNLSALTTLNLWTNQLTGIIPSNLTNLSSLTHLILEENQLTGGIPSWIGNLSNLMELNLSANPLGGRIPAALQHLTNLQFLYLIDNQLTGSIPQEIGNMTSLRDLFFDRNQLRGTIPASLGNLTNLQWLILEDNMLCGEIPGSLINLTNLVDYAPPSLQYGLHLENNYLFTNDPSLDSFLASKGGDWQSTQGENCPSNSFWNLVLPAILHTK